MCGNNQLGSPYSVNIFLDDNDIIKSLFELNTEAFHFRLFFFILVTKDEPATDTLSYFPFISTKTASGNGKDSRFFNFTLAFGIMKLQSSQCIKRIVDFLCPV